jgi:hypothetical protein
MARVCLDCEEVHDAQHCPVCASETFAYLTNWVPAPERRARPRPPTKSSPTVSPQVAVGAGVAGAILFAIARWSKRARERLEGTTNGEIGELR